MVEATSKSILVVEDEPDVAEICRITLADEGFTVDIAPNGRLARDMIKTKQYDLCLIDIILPIMTGVELYEWLADNNAEMARRVAFISGDILTSSTQVFINNTNRPFLPKPFSPDQLKVFVRMLLR